MVERVSCETLGETGTIRNELNCTGALAVLAPGGNLVATGLLATWLSTLLAFTRARLASAMHPPAPNKGLIGNSKFNSKI